MAADSQKSGSLESVDDSLVSQNNTFVTDCTNLEEHRDQHAAGFGGITGFFLCGANGMQTGSSEVVGTVV